MAVVDRKRKAPLNSQVKSSHAKITLIYFLSPPLTTTAAVADHRTSHVAAITL
jgi:hypothetical protein